MGEQMYCKEMRKNPELFKNELQKGIDNIAESISKNDNWKEPTSTFHNSLSTLITDMWSQQNLANKLLTLSEMEETSPPDTIAWRPTVGEVPELTFKGNHLQERKNMLLIKLKQSQEELEKLNKPYNLKEQLMKKHIKKPSKAIEFTNSVINTYERIRSFNETI